MLYILNFRKENLDISGDAITSEALQNIVSVAQKIANISADSSGNIAVGNINSSGTATVVKLCIGNTCIDENYLKNLSSNNTNKYIDASGNATFNNINCSGIITGDIVSKNISRFNTIGSNLIGTKDIVSNSFSIHAS